MELSLPRHLELWLPAYLRWKTAKVFQSKPAGVVDILLCIADHFEPDHGKASMSRQVERVARWRRDYPRLLDRFRDADGHPPQHTFFFPAEAYCAEHLDQLAELCAAGYGEVEVHLHHGHDTPERLRRTLETFRDTLAHRHGLLATDPQGRTRYAFIHGNWALDNGRLDDTFCGVNDELTILRETGCYADLTMPAAPDRAQSRTINQLYYAVDDPQLPRSYDWGVRCRVRGVPPADALLMVQGPLELTWRRTAILPGIENGALDQSIGHHPSAARFRKWVGCGISVADRPEWIVVKIHTHGAKEANADVLLGSLTERFHESIGLEFNDGDRYRLHYVTTRELVNIIHAAENGETGNPNAYRDYRFQSRVKRRVNSGVDSRKVGAGISEPASS